VAFVRSALLLSMIGVLGLCGGSDPARADHEPVLVVPTRPDVPVIINGVDVSWCVVEGDWGLYRPNAVPLTVTCPYRVGRPRAATPGDDIPDYYPRTGRKPAVGRLEVLPPADRAPRPARSFYRLWTTPPDQAPVTEYAPYSGPPVVVAPRVPFHP
jgi:hypothetical protein